MNLDAGQLMSNLAEQAIWILVKILIALAFYFVGRWVIGRLLRILDRMFEKKAVDISIRPFIRNTVSVLMIVALLLVVVQTLGVNVTSLIAIFSAATLAIGMALSGNLSNFAGGVIILIFRPYKVGDYIEASTGAAGTVKEIQIFHTVLITPDNKTVYAPNGAMSGAVVINYSKLDTRRLDFTINVEYGCDFKQVREILLSLIEADQRILTTPAPFVELGALSASSVDITVRVWVQASDYWAVNFDMNKNVYATFNEKGISFPFPQLTVHQG